MNACTREPAAGVRHTQPQAPDMDWIHRLPYRDWIELEASRTAPKEARRRLAGDLEEWSLGQFEMPAMIVLSEIVTNAVFASNSLIATAVPPPVKVWLLGGPLVVALLAWDASAEPPVRRWASDTDESGRGLTIVERLSAQWGYYPVATGGKVTWAIINRP